MKCIIDQTRKTEVRKDGIPVLRVKVTGFFTLNVELFQGSKLIFKAKHFTIAFYRSIKILYQDLPDEIELLKTNLFSFNLLFRENELSIKYKLTKAILFQNWTEIGIINYSFGRKFTEMDLQSDDENLAMYFLILYFLFNPKENK